MEGTLPLRIPGGPVVLSEILEGGQTFLWERKDDNLWCGVQAGRPFHIRIDRENHLTWKCPDSFSDGASAAIHSLFATATDFAAEVDRLPWRSDPLLCKAVETFPGLRILRQEIGVTILSFLLSPLKRIEQIRAGLLAISRRWGTELSDGLYSPLDWSTLSTISEEELRTCGIGYRAKSIRGTALFLADHPNYLLELESLPTLAARDRLLALPGVGRKIADCVLLFGLGRLEAFPIDTWISRQLREGYQLAEYNDNQLQAFAKAHFGKAAGFAQQFLFAAARNPAITHSEN